ncbi:hypothetical protein L0337_12905 [candidate division KSB1 bacterium]|nr:hypothetical protein [candidate division KSB1 bacterium]
MSKCDLHIVFDHDDRTYKLGEAIAGKIQVLAREAFHCRKITLICAWRTQGRGNKASGGEEGMAFAEDVKFQSGELKEYPFQFSARRGPVSYHGQCLNVEWYLRAQVDIPVAIDVIREEKFMLAPGDISQEIILGTEDESEEAAAPSSFKERMTMARVLAVPFFVLGVAMVVLGGSNLVALLLGLAVAGFGGWQLFMMLRNKLAQQRVSALEVKVHPVKIRAGNAVACKFLFDSRDARRLRKITATLKAEERVVSGAGGLKNTHTHKIYETVLEQSNQEVAAFGDKTEIKIPVPIPPHAPGTFRAPDNALIWSIRVQIDIPDWPDWVQEFPITVIP